jgi:type IV secretory pathway component VirB8
MVSPSQIISRVTVFILAAQLVVVLALLITLSNMFPLTKTQIFFMDSAAAGKNEITIVPSIGNMIDEKFKVNFVKQYILYRMTVIPNADVMRSRWNAENGMVRAWSTPEVFGNFLGERSEEGQLVRSVLAAADPKLGNKNIPFLRRVEIIGSPVPVGENKYSVDVRKIFSMPDNSGQTLEKESRITLTLKFEGERTIASDDRLRNPFGVVVSEFKEEDINKE